jgi:glycosyltransferase involved in cell wall biosynthesis
MSMRRRFGALRDRLARRLLGVSRSDIMALSAHLDEVAAEAEASRTTADSEAGRLGEEIQRLREDATAHLKQLTEALAGVEARLRVTDDDRLRADLHARIAPTMAWIALDEVPEDRLISVVVASRDRGPRLRRAIGSVLAQSYSRWELVVVDDGSGDETPEVLGSLGAPNLRVVRTDRLGVGAARNRGLAEATGDIVAYLDDDNLMHPDWLRSVAWAFARAPDTRFVYGARLVDDPSRIGIPPEGGSPAIHFEPYDRRRLEEGNFIDLGVVAHRAGLPEARFDESLTTQGDWDLALRLSQGGVPVALPVLACLYATSAPDRLSDDPSKWEEAQRIRVRIRESRPLRVLGYNQFFPMITETYMEEELEALAGHGADIAYCRRVRSVSEITVPRPVFDDLDRAIREFGPDLLFLHWAGFAEQEHDRLLQLGLPFGVRVHSFDFDPQAAARILAQPNCVGLWAYPRHAEVIPGSFPLPAMLTSVDRLPDPAPVRDVVLSVSAGLPKKDWGVLVDALCRLDGVDRRVVMGRSDAYDDLPEEIAARLAGCDGSRVQVNLPRDEVFALLARTAVLLYTLEPGRTFGNPMSVVEGLCAGAAVVVPDRPDALEFAGPHARGYRTASDIEGHVREVLAGGPAIAEEHRANRRFGLERFADDLVGKRFFVELTEAVARWRASR